MMKINEEMLQEAVNPIYTGEEIAEMLGMGDKYRNGKAQIAQGEEMMESVKKEFSSMMTRLNENDKKNRKDIID